MTAEGNAFSFVWKIENFSMLAFEINDEIDSETFVIDKWKNIDLYLTLLLSKEPDENTYITPFLTIIRQVEVEVKLNISFTIESTEPSTEITSTKENCKFERWKGFSKFASLSDVLSNKRLYLPQDTLTLRCDICPIEETSADAVSSESKSIPRFFEKSCVSRTCIEVQRRTIMWSIPNIQDRIDRLEGTTITLGSALKDTPCLELTMSTNKGSSDDFIQILIRQTDLLLKTEGLFAKCKITLTSANEDYQVFKKSTHLFQLNISDVWSFPPFLTSSMLTDENYHFVDETLLLRCEFAFSYKDKIHHLENTCMPFTYERRMNKSQLSTCLENIYGDDKFCDVEIQADGETFPYYKVILCARSPVFDAMFENNMREKNSNVVEIDDVDVDTLQRMLKYMHTDVLEEDLQLEDACRLYGVADKYDIKCLKQKCTAFLLSDLSVESVCEILVCADVHQNGLLMTAACEFISNHSNEVLFSKQWKSIMDDHLELTSKVMHQMLTGKYRI